MAPLKAFADEVVLMDGERLIGKVQALANGKLTFTSDRVGTVTIGTGDVRTLTTDSPVRVSLKDRTVLNGSLRGGQDAHLVVEVGGERRDVPLSQVEEIRLGAYRWKGSATAGLTLFQNQIDSRTTALAVKANRQTPTTNAVLDSAYLFSRDGGVTTQDSAFLNGDYRTGLERRRSGFVNGGLQTDRVQKLDLRVLLGTGYGYQWRTSADFNFRTDVGLSLRYEDFQDAAADWRPAAQLGYALDGKLPRGLKYGHNMAFFPALFIRGDYYLRAEFTLEQPLGGAFSFNARAILDETTRPGPDAARYTSKYIFGLGVSF
jgi:putative salt-induced outer membrane protein YdiY